MTNSSYQISLREEYVPLGSVLTSSETPFTGSVLPSGELFDVYWLNNNFANTNTSDFQDLTIAQATASYITDVKITLHDPANTQPFSFIYPTGSTEFDNWYTTMSISA